jgi:hypothetical protein
MIRWLIDFRYAVHYGLNSDIARGPKTCTEADITKFGRGVSRIV